MKKQFNFETHHPITGFKNYTQNNEDYFMKVKSNGEDKPTTKSALK